MSNACVGCELVEPSTAYTPQNSEVNGNICSNLEMNEMIQKKQYNWEQKEVGE